MHRLFLVVCCVILGSPFACRADVQPAAPSSQTAPRQWSCRDIADLAKKYDADRKLTDAVSTQGETCPRGEAAACLLAVIDKVREKCAKEGKDAVPPEDIARLNSLRNALREELEQTEGYVTRREAIEALLTRPDELEVEYKFGVNGFLRGDAAGNFRLPFNAFKPGHNEERFVYRIKPYVYWHPTDWLGFHVEGQEYGYTGRTQNYGRFNLYQGYVEAKLPGSDLVALKGGRQEFIYGSAFILGADSFFDGLTFDAARLRIKPAARLSIDLLGGVYATPFSGGVNGDLSGVYATYTFSEGNALDAYFIRDAGTLAHNSGDYLNIFGLRGTAKAGPATFEFEPVYETGMRNGGHVNAYGGHLDMNADTTVAEVHNHVFLSVALGSGDRSAPYGPSSRKEFRNPNNDSSLVGDMHVIGDLSGVNVNGHHASGLQIYTLGWGVDITKTVNFSATGRYFLANETEAGFRREVGLETDFTLTWNIAEGLSLIAGYDRFFTGGFFKDASVKRGVIHTPFGGWRFYTLPGSDKDIDYGYLMLQFDLSKSKPRMKPVKG